jgi:hypothetical protein
MDAGNDTESHQRVAQHHFDDLLIGHCLLLTGDTGEQHRSLLIIVINSGDVADAVFCIPWLRLQKAETVFAFDFTERRYMEDFCACISSPLRSASPCSSK